MGRLSSLWRSLFRNRLPAGSFTYLVDSSGQPHCALLCLPERTGAEILSRFQTGAVTGSSGHRGLVSGSVVDLLSAASPLIASSLKAGHLLQIVGTPQLMEGLSSGAYSLVQTQSGLLGTVVDASRAQIVGQLRFMPASVAGVMGPMIVWQVLHALAGVHQLARINERLECLQRGIQQILFRQHVRSYARFATALVILDDIGAQHGICGRFTEDMRLRLALAERDLQCVLLEEQVHVANFKREKDAILGTKGKQGAVNAIRLLRERPEFFLDIELLAMAHRAAITLQQMSILRDLEAAPEYVPCRLSKLEREVAAIQEVSDVANHLEALLRHAEASVEGMGWLQRQMNWAVVKQLPQLLEDFRGWARLESRATDSVLPALLIWRERTGRPRGVVMDCPIALTG